MEIRITLKELLEDSKFTDFRIDEVKIAGQYGDSDKTVPEGAVELKLSR